MLERYTNIRTMISAIHMILSNADICRVQLLLGHANLNTTQVYLQLKSADLREMYNRVEFQGSSARSMLPTMFYGITSPRVI